MSDKFRVLVTDGVSASGVDVLRANPQIEVVECKSMKEDELVSKIVDFDALVVRSQTKVTAKAIEVSSRLKVVGRAGVGVDNVDVEAATRKGIVVMNTPGGNTISTAELSFSMLLSLARQIPQAHQTMREGKWDRKSFQGIEVNGKVLGIVGMGRIGTEVARRAFAFGMKVLVYDPYLSLARARSLQVELFENIDEMLPQCDFISLHMPLNKETKGIINTQRLALCKPSIRIVNCARGGLVEEAALEAAIKAGKCAGAALDVYEQEPPGESFGLRSLPQIVMTPHLGASTYEAQENVGIEVAEAIRDMLLTGTVRNAVNMPNVEAKTLAALKPYLQLALQLGRLLRQVSPERAEKLTVTYYGKISEQDTTAITRAALKGFLLQAGGSDVVNEVNAPKYAESLGLKFSEVKQSEVKDYSELIAIRVESSKDSAEVRGTLFGTNSRLVGINNYNLEACPEGVLLFMENRDRPGIVGWIGTLLGKHKVNIASMSLSRAEPGSKALSVLNLDELPSKEVLDEIKQDKDIYSVRTVQL